MGFSSSLSSSAGPGCSSSSSGISSSSSWVQVVVVVVPLILISGIVCVLIPKTYWVSSVSYHHDHPWVFRSSKIPPSLSARSSSTAFGSSSSSITKQIDDDDITNTRMMGGGDHVLHQAADDDEEVLSEETFTSLFNRSSPPQLPKETIHEIHQPPDEIIKQDDDDQAGLKSSSASKQNLSSNVVVVILDDDDDETTRKMHKKKKDDYNSSSSSKLGHLETGLARARAAIREASLFGNKTISDPDYVPVGPMYWNPHAFHRSYLEMEKQFKVFIYEEGDPPLFHSGPCKSIYSIEGNFIHQMEIHPRFRTHDPDRAHVYFLPFSVVMMVRFVYVPDSHDITPIKKTVIDYVDVVGSKYPFWNRSLGADHLMLSCHDWGPMTSTYIPHLYKNSIRALCNANTSEGFRPSKDLSIPEINLKTGDTKDLIGGPSPSHRPILAFFAGGLHGPIRPVLLEHWMDKDDEIRVYKYLPKRVSYQDMMKKSKYCICPSGYEVASPRIVEALYTGCVPVLISDHYVLPFSDVLNWKSFSVEVPVSEIPNLKKILTGISQRQYIKMQRRGLKVRRHFEVNAPPKKFDVFHMILHSIWLRRLNVQIHDQ